MSGELLAITICSVSASLATQPSSFVPLFKNRVPAKCLDRRAISAISRDFPYNENAKGIIVN
jgi:hypothetical protein